jgi:anti-sigma regulatory factor (Ser/Thr protein kinase)
LKRTRTFPEASSSVPGARRFVAESLPGVDPEVRDTAALLVSELATNAIVHAESEFAVTVVYPTASGRVRVEVTDQDETKPAPTRPGPTAPHGRGLLLVSTMADAWGVRDARHRSGKAVWFELTPPAEAADGAAASASRETRGLRRWRGRLSSLFGVDAALPALPTT